MIKPESDYPQIRERYVDVDPQEALLVEYQEVGEEFRNYEQLLNRAYYLSAVVFTFFVGAAANLIGKPQNEELLLFPLVFVAGFTFFILGISAKQYHQRRDSAVELRNEIAADIHELSNSDVPRLQKIVVGDGQVIHANQEGNPFSERDRTWLQSRLDTDKVFTQLLFERYPIWRFNVHFGLLCLLAGLSYPTAEIAKVLGFSL